MWQAEWVAQALENAGVATELVPLASEGDIDMRPIRGTTGSGVFTKSIQEAVLDERADVAVHSLKDLPTTPAPGLRLAAIPPREDIHDCLISPHGARLADVPQEAVVGSGSRRRQAQLLAARSDLTVLPIRGNVQTRIRKVAEGEFAATILARAGLLRMQLTEWVDRILPLDVMLPAPGQGALGIEVRSDDATAITAVEALEDRDARAATTAERSCLRALEGGCLAPIAALATVSGDSLHLKVRVLSIDGREALEDEILCPRTEAEKAGEVMAQRLLERGAARLLAEARSE